MNDKQISSFLAVAESGSFSRAARKQYISPQAIIQQIDLLEKEVGVSLLVRSHKGVSLTLAGHHFYVGALRLSSELNELLQHVRSFDESSKEVLRVGLFDTKMMDQICNKFSQSYPDIKQEYVMTATEAWLDDLKLISSGHLDVQEHAECPEVYQSGICFESLIRSGTFCAVPVTHPLAGKKAILPSDLNGYLVGIHSRSCVPGLTELLKTEAPNSTLIDGEKSTLSAFDVCAKGGVFLFPDISNKRFSPLQIIPLKCSLAWHFGLVYKENPSPLVQLFIDNAKAQFPQT